MKKTLYILLFFANTLFAQSTIILPGGNNSNIQLSGAKNGISISGLTTQERDAIQNPSVGYTIYNKTTSCIEFYNGFKWNNFCENQTIANMLKVNLVAFYPFNGSANDQSGNNLHGVVNGATLTTDRFNNTGLAYSFGDNQNIVIPNTESRNLYPLSVSLWYYVNETIPNKVANIFSKYSPASWNGFQILYGDFRNVSNNNETINDGFGVTPWYIKDYNNRVIAYFGEPSFTQRNLQAKKWYHFVFVVDNSGGKIYVNGDLIATDIWTGNYGASSNSYLWKIGGEYDNMYFQGKIDDIYIWNKAITAEEVLYLYNH